MFELKFGNFSAAFDFSFFASVTLLIVLGDQYAVLGLVACLLHESGHLIVMKICGISVRRILFYGAGIKIMPDKRFYFTDFGTEFAVLIAGSLANFSAVLLPVFFDTPEVKLFSVINGIIGVFNLLPLQYLDGGKLIIAVIRRYCDYTQACLLERYHKWLNIFLIISVMIAFAYAGKGNFTLFLTLCYLLASAVFC